MRPSRARFSAPDASYRMPWSAACITNTFESEFSVHTRIISAVIATDAKRFCHQIKTDEVLGTYRCLSNKTALAMIFKLAEAAEKSWRRLDGHNQFPKIILGVKFANGIEVVRPQAQPVAA